MESVVSNKERMLWPAASQNSCRSSWLPVERRQPGPCMGSHTLGHRATCRALWEGMLVLAPAHVVLPASCWCCHCPVPTDGNSPIQSPSRDFAGFCCGESQLLPLPGGAGSLAFQVEALWVLATHAFVPTAAKGVVFLTVCPHFVVTPHLAVSHWACA